MGYRIMSTNTFMSMGYPAIAINTVYHHSIIERSRPMSNEQEKLDKVVNELEKQGITLDNYKENKEGLGDVISNVFSKFGISEATVEKWSGIGGCGCQKRKKFLNKIIPFRKKA